MMAYHLFHSLRIQLQAQSLHLSGERRRTPFAGQERSRKRRKGYYEAGNSLAHRSGIGLRGILPPSCPLGIATVTNGVLCYPRNGMATPHAHHTSFLAK